MIYLVSLALALLLGFAAHRASLCSVRAVEEMLASQRMRILGSFVKTALWTMAVALPISWLWPERAVPVQVYAFSVGAVVGGFVFGLGAALNGGCTFSTLGYLADGCLWMLATLFGFCTGIAAWRYAADAMLISSAQPLMVQMSRSSMLVPVCLLLWLWAGWESLRLWRSRASTLSWRKRICAERYSLSVAALILGGAGGALYTLHGSWTYTTVFKREVESLMTAGVGPPVLLMWLFLAVFAGMVLSSWTRGSFQLRWRGGGWLRRFLGGLLMGLGGALIPGGNDELILRAIPALSPHAVPAYLALLVGISFALLLLRIAHRFDPTIGLRPQ